MGVSYAIPETPAANWHIPHPPWHRSPSLGVIDGDPEIPAPVLPLAPLLEDEISMSPQVPVPEIEVV